ncbi:MAG: biopolymer transporter ExbD [Hyphomonas sp.]|nr:biopolymer transporter ExbD [Hyphomonas sp.]
MKARAMRASDAEVSLTPMLDIVFILLIFFVVTSTFTKERVIGVEAPTNETGAGEGKAMIIRVGDDSVISVDGRITDIGSIRAAIERVRAETPDIRIMIEAHPKAKSGVIVHVRDAAYDAGYRDGVNLVLAQT